jgi:hypothetical protein
MGFPTSQEYRAAQDRLNQLMAQGDDGRTREEDALLDLLATMVDLYERGAYPIFGLSQPPSAVNIASASGGPQVPGS